MLYPPFIDNIILNINQIIPKNFFITEHEQKFNSLACLQKILVFVLSVWKSLYLLSSHRILKAILPEYSSIRQRLMV